jgi:hypothetical protein
MYCWRTDTATLAVVGLERPWEYAERWPSAIADALARAGCAWAS